MSAVCQRILLGSISAADPDHDCAAVLAASPALRRVGLTRGASLPQVLVMTVEPGFGGQSFMPAMMEKVGGRLLVTIALVCPCKLLCTARPCASNG